MNLLRSLFSISFSGSVLALLLMGIKRLLGQRVSGVFVYYAWLVVLLRLAVPVGVELALPVLPVGQVSAVDYEVQAQVVTDEAATTLEALPAQQEPEKKEIKRTSDNRMRFLDN